MSGSGSPVMGNSPIVIAMFTKIWLKKRTLNPNAIVRPNSSMALHDVLRHLAIKIV